MMKSLIKDSCSRIKHSVLLVYSSPGYEWAETAVMVKDTAGVRGERRIRDGKLGQRQLSPDIFLNQGPP